MNYWVVAYINIWLVLTAIGMIYVCRDSYIHKLQERIESIEKSEYRDLDNLQTCKVMLDSIQNNPYMLFLSILLIFLIWPVSVVRFTIQAIKN
jgi:hypothetical protein